MSTDATIALATIRGMSPAERIAGNAHARVRTGDNAYRYARRLFDRLTPQDIADIVTILLPLPETQIRYAVLAGIDTLAALAERN